MIGLPGRIIETITNGPEAGETLAVSMAGLSPIDGSIVLPERTFQFWPESLTETPIINWNFKDIPGLSHSLAQWTQNGGRTFSFELQLSRYMRPWNSMSTAYQLRSMGTNTPENNLPLNNLPMNISVKEQIQWFRMFYLPDYAEQNISGINATVSIPPLIAILCFPNMGLNEDGSDVIWGVMTSAPVVYSLCFPSGEPRLASISLEFRQIIQWPGRGIIPKTRTMAARFLDGNNAEDSIMPGGDRPVNNLDPSRGP